MSPIAPAPIRSARSAGFTLVEVAVVIVVMALILGSILLPLSAQIEQRQVVDTQRQIEDVKEALIGFALAQTPPRIPCPDKTQNIGNPADAPNDGIEDVEPTGNCTTLNGNIPWTTLGLAAVDPWGNRYRYRVSTNVANRPPAGVAIALGPPFGDVSVCTNTACGPGQRVTEAPNTTNAALAVILSHGPNGWWGLNATTNLVNTKPTAPAVGVDETANGNGGALFISYARTTDDGSNPLQSREFDDIVGWLSPHTLKHRLVAAGKLP